MRVRLTITDRPPPAHGMPDPMPDVQVLLHSSPDLPTLLELDAHGRYTTSAVRYGIAAWVGLGQLMRLAAPVNPLHGHAPALDRYRAQLLGSGLERQALQQLHQVCARMDLANQAERPTEEEYQAAMAAAAAVLGLENAGVEPRRER